MAHWHTCPDGHSWAVRIPNGDDLPPCPTCGRTAVPLGETSVSATQRVGGAVVVRPSRPTPTARLGDSPLAHLPHIPGYDLLGILGHGGMGIVYRARQRNLDRLVALKMIRDAHVSTPEELLRFRAEALAVAQLAHPNIIRIHEIGDHEGLPYISLELIEGGTLDDWLGDRPQPVEDAVGFVIQVAHAVQAAHARGLLHRDLKPANLLLDWEPGSDRSRLRQATPKVADFGLVKRIGAADGPTLTGEVVGTPAYMAPEQANPSGAVGPWTDVYALGAILYELLTGRPPFRAPTGMATLRLVLDAEPVPPRRFRRDLPRDLETIVLKCLAKDPRRRYLSAEEFAADLARFRAGEPIAARPVGLAARLALRVRRNPVVASLTGVLVVVLLGVAVAGGVLWHNQAEQHRRAAETTEGYLDAALVLERQAAYERALEKLAAAEEHLRRGAAPHLRERVAEARSRLEVSHRQAQHEQAERTREAALARGIELARLDLLGLERDGKVIPADGSDLRRLLRASGIAIGQAAAAEIVARVRQRPRIKREVLDALVVCFAGSQNRDEAEALLAALDTLEGLPGTRPVLVALLADPEQFLDPAFGKHLGELPAVYALMASTRLSMRKNYDGAVRLLRTAILKRPNEFWLHYNLGYTLQTRVPAAPAAALSAYFAALALRPHSGHTLTNLGQALVTVGRTEEGLECLEQACRHRPDYATYQTNLGVALRATGHLDRARAALTRALAIHPESVAAHVEMGFVEVESGNLDAALVWFRKGVDLAGPDDPSRAGIGFRVQRVQQLRRLDTKLDAILAGTAQPASVLEAADLMELAYFKGKHLAAYRLTKRFFAEYPGLETDRKGAWYRFNAACYAALVCAGKGDGAARLTPAEVVAVRADALRWLRDELADLKRLASGTPRQQLAANESLHEWLTDAALLAVRERVWIERMPPSERKAWGELWAEVDVLLEQWGQASR